MSNSASIANSCRNSGPKLELFLYSLARRQSVLISNTPLVAAGLLGVGPNTWSAPLSRQRVSLRSVSRARPFDPTSPRQGSPLQKSRDQGSFQDRSGLGPGPG